MTDKTVNCPTCGKVTLFAPSNPFRPFCSERCRNIDFGNWANENYTIKEPTNDTHQDLDDYDSNFDT